MTVRWIAEGGHVAFPEGTDAGLGEEEGVEEQVLGWLRGQGTGGRRGIP